MDSCKGMNYFFFFFEWTILDWVNQQMVEWGITMAPSPTVNVENNTTSLDRIQVEISKSHNTFHHKIPSSVFMKE